SPLTALTRPTSARYCRKSPATRTSITPSTRSGSKSCSARSAEQHLHVCQAADVLMIGSQRTPVERVHVHRLQPGRASAVDVVADRVADVHSTFRRVAHWVERVPTDPRTRSA